MKIKITIGYMIARLAAGIVVAMFIAMEPASGQDWGTFLKDTVDKVVDKTLEKVSEKDKNPSKTPQPSSPDKKGSPSKPQQPGTPSDSNDDDLLGDIGDAPLKDAKGSEPKTTGGPDAVQLKLSYSCLAYALKYPEGWSLTADANDSSKIVLRPKDTPQEKLRLVLRSGTSSSVPLSDAIDKCRSTMEAKAPGMRSGQTRPLKSKGRLNAMEFEFALDYDGTSAKGWCRAVSVGDSISYVTFMASPEIFGVYNSEAKAIANSLSLPASSEQGDNFNNNDDDLIGLPDNSAVKKSGTVSPKKNKTPPSAKSDDEDSLVLPDTPDEEKTEDVPKKGNKTPPSKSDDDDFSY